MEKATAHLSSNYTEQTITFPVSHPRDLRHKARQAAALFGDDVTGYSVRAAHFETCDKWQDLVFAREAKVVRFVASSAGSIVIKDDDGSDLKVLPIAGENPINKAVEPILLVVHLRPGF